MCKRLTAAVLCLLLFAPALARADQASRAELVELARASGSMEVIGAILDMVPMQIFKGVKAKSPDAPDALLDILTEEFAKERRAVSREMLNMTADAWGCHLTRGEVLELTRLYQNPVFKKAVKLGPQIMQRSMAQSQAMAQQLMQRVMPRIKDRLRDELGMDI
ncbi:DUF2059 domain-containing protein [Desulfocurvus sp. DL9XJH121]